MQNCSHPPKNTFYWVENFISTKKIVHKVGSDKNISFIYIRKPKIQKNSGHYLIKTISKWDLSSVQLTEGSTVGATERNKPFPRKVCITACCAIFRTKHCVNRNGGMHSCAACQEGNYTFSQSSDSHSWSSAHKKHTGTVPSWTQAVRPTQNTDL